ncbi:MAG: hypothetical protein IJQ22_04685 [Bacteroidales bacterium]|nr:hypothetical protein [Bacteroidales bacterium]
MKKLIFSSIILLAALAGCTKVNQIESQTKEGKTITLSANLPQGTKVAFVSNGAANEGFTTSFAGDEKLYMWCQGNLLKYNKLTVSSYTESSATFSGTLTSVPPAYPAKYGAFVTSRKLYGDLKPWASYWFSYNNDNTLTFVNRLCLDQQDGTAAMATAASALFAKGTLADADDTPTLSFDYLTSILKFVVTLPDGVVANSTNTEITIGGTNIYSYIWLDELEGTLKAEKSSDPDSWIYIKPNASIFSGQTITGYACLWTGASSIKIKDATIDVIVDGTHHYTVPLANSTGSTINHGKVYTFAPASPLAFNGVSKWVNDEATTVNIPAGLTTAAEPPTWLSYNSGTGVVTIAANDTDSPRQGKIEFTSGAIVDITQLEEADFAGSWTLKGDTRTTTEHGAAVKASAAVAKTGDGYGKLTGKTKNSWYDDTWAAPAAASGTETPLTITYNSTEPTDNKYNITGIFEDLVMPAKISIDYENQSATFYPYIPNTNVLQGSGATYEGEYLGFATELKNASGGGQWQLGFGNGGAFYFNCPVTVTGDKTTATFSGSQTCTAYTTYNVVGLLVNRYAASGTGGGNLIRSQKSFWAYANVDSGGAAYAQVTQGAFTLTK